VHFYIAVDIFGYGAGPVAIGWCNDSVFDVPQGVVSSFELVMMMSAPLVALTLFLGRHILVKCLDTVRAG
jgi:hypothetical protein